MTATLTIPRVERAVVAAQHLHEGCGALVRWLELHQGVIVNDARAVSVFRSARFGGAKRRYRSRARAIVTRFIAGLLTREIAVGNYERAYREAAREAAEVGAAKAGAELTLTDLAALDAEVARTTDKFSAFLRDIQTARLVTGDVDTVFPGGVDARLDLYINRMDGVRNATWAEAAGGDGVLWWWNLGFADHCPDCVTLHMMSPFREAPPTVPRASGTRCSSNCKCVLVRTTGASRR